VRRRPGHVLSLAAEVWALTKSDLARLKDFARENARLKKLVAELDSIRPTRPVDNAFIESFNRQLRDERLDVH
jgi:hypothetical protein